jgi:hypothetical protein
MAESAYNTTPEELITFTDIGYKLMPLDENCEEIESWTPIYDNPHYWTAEKLRQEAYKFKNVATVFGKTRLSDDKGELYLNELDIDSESVYNILFNLKHDISSKETYSLIPLMQERTFVIKTRKPNGFRISWLSHKQNKAIHITDCKKGFEFEIKTDKTSGHSTLPRSRHRKDPSFHYTNQGQQKLVVSDKLYDELVTTLSDCLNSKEKPKVNKMRGVVPINLSNESIQKIYEFIAPYYQELHRNALVFTLSGLFHKMSISEDSTINLIQLLANDDEERSNRINVVVETYKKDPSIVSGNDRLLEILELATEDKNTAKKTLDKILKIITNEATEEEDFDEVIWLTDIMMKEHSFRTATDNEELFWYDGTKYVTGQVWRIKQLCQIIQCGIRT